MNNGHYAAIGLFVVAFIIAAILFGPLLTIWVINTLILRNIDGATTMPYSLFTVYWWAALLGGGIIGGLFGAKKK